MVPLALASANEKQFDESISVIKLFGWSLESWSFLIYAVCSSLARNRWETSFLVLSLATTAAISVCGCHLTPPHTPDVPHSQNDCFWHSHGYPIRHLPSHLAVSIHPSPCNYTVFLHHFTLPGSSSNLQ